MNLVEYKSNLKTVIRGLLRMGKYKLIARLILVEYKVQKLRRAKERHNRRRAKVEKQAIILQNEIAVTLFQAQMDVYNNTGMV